jgi:signal transduction histidine kinase
VSSASWWRALGGRYAISWVSAVLSTGLALASALWTVRNYPVDQTMTLVGQAAGIAALLGVLLVARLTWLRPERNERQRPWLTLLTFAAASAARVALVAIVAVATGEWGQWPAEQTVIFGFMGQVVLLAVVAISVNAVRASTESIRRLEGARQTVERARVLTEADVADRERRFVEQVLESVQSSLSDLSTSTDHADVVDEVRRMAQEVVRPASHDLHSGVIAYEAVQGPSPRIRLRDVLADVEPVAPIAGPVAYEVLVFGSLWGALGARAAIVNFLVGTAVLIAAAWLLGTVFRRSRGGRGRLLTLAVGYTLGNLAALLVVLTAISGTTDRSDTLWIGLGIYPGFMLLISIVSSIARQNERRETDLNEALESEAQALTRVSNLAAEQRLQLSRLIHGGLQADLIAAAKLIESSRTTEDAQASARARVITLAEEISDRYAALDAPIDDQRLSDLVETWQLAADVELNVDELAAQALEADIRLRSQVVSIVSEALTNAVRHGSGSTIYVNVTDGSAVLSITVTHDGELQTGESGLGLSEIDRIAESWELAQQGERVVLHAEVGRRG